MYVNYYYQTIEKVWPTSYAVSDLAGWLGKSVYGCARYLFSVSLIWSPLSWIVGTLTLVAVASGWTSIRSKCPVILWAVCILFAGTVLAGALKIWPFGNIRHVTFLVPIVCLFVGVGIAEQIKRFGRTPVTVLLVAGCVLIPLGRATKATLSPPTATEHVRPVFAFVDENRKPGDALFIYYPDSDAYEFYWNDPDVPTLLQPRSDREKDELFLQRFESWIRDHKRVWFVSAHDWKTERVEWIALLKNRYELISEFETIDASAQLFVRLPLEPT